MKTLFPVLSWSLMFVCQPGYLILSMTHPDALKRRSFLIVLSSVMVAVILLFAIISRRTHENPSKGKPLVTQSNVSNITQSESRLTPTEANYINRFARKHDMTVERVMRWEYVLARRGLDIKDYDKALTRLAESADKALGYHVVRPKQNLETPLVNSGDLRPAQDSQLTADEEAIVRTLKAAGY